MCTESLENSVNVSIRTLQTELSGFGRIREIKQNTGDLLLLILHEIIPMYCLQSVGSAQKEAMYINKSLTFLEQVIVALADKRREHIPYRQSKLTHVLKDSLGGTCNTLMIATIWAEPKQIEETVSEALVLVRVCVYMIQSIVFNVCYMQVSTLKFSTRMMCVPNDPVKSTQHNPYVSYTVCVFIPCNHCVFL